MPDHLIRLRGGWNRLGVDASTPVSRLTLPLVGPLDGPGLLRLSRHFQTPRLNPALESLWLRLDDVPGLSSLVLNGLEITTPSNASSLLIPLPLFLPARNELCLEAEPTFTPGSRWGEIALVIRRAGATG